jgi:hypothetical protein
MKATNSIPRTISYSTPCENAKYVAKIGKPIDKRYTNYDEGKFTYPDTIIVTNRFGEDNQYILLPKSQRMSDGVILPDN